VEQQRKVMGFSPENIAKTANFHMIHLKTPCRGSIHMPNRKEIDINHDL